jgi:hypothetical protein
MLIFNPGDLWNMFIWLILEVYVAIICASVPALKPLYTQWMQTPISKAYGSYRRSKESRETTDSMSWDSYPNKNFRREFEPLEGKGSEMNIFVRSDIEMVASEVRRDGGEGDDEEPVLPKRSFSALPSPPPTPKLRFANWYSV